LTDVLVHVEVDSRVNGDCAETSAYIGNVMLLTHV